MHELPDVKLLLKTELDALRTQMTRQTEAPPENVAAIDVFDGAQTVEQQEFVALSTSRLARRAGEVRNALERLREGNYGLCEDCGNPISAPRLVDRSDRDDLCALPIRAGAATAEIRPTTVDGRPTP
jgi:RNA polymerase-binding transcription factor DksA